MGRPPKFSTDELLDAAADLLTAGGPSALSAAAVARAVGAPSGSVYHRFPSRDHLAASLWMRTVERFDREVAAGLTTPGDPVEVAVGVAVRSVEWSARHPTDAQILTLFRLADLTDGDLDPDLAQRAEELGQRQRAAMGALADRLGQPADLVRLAVAGIPMAAMRRPVGEHPPVPAWAADAIERATRAVLASDVPPNDVPSTELPANESPSPESSGGALP
jgi:AcrR family transcriptional regulator